MCEGGLDFKGLGGDEEMRLFGFLAEEKISVVKFERKEMDLEDLFMEALK